MGVATLAAVAVVLFVSISSLRAVQRIEADFDRRLDRVDDRIAEVSEKVAGRPAPAAEPAPPPKGQPDPDRVYTIKTAGAPAKGPASAAVTIAEFSDFQ